MAQVADEIVAAVDHIEMGTGGRSSPVSQKSHGTNKGDATTEDSTAQVVAVGRGGADAGLEAMGYTPQLKRNRGQLEIQGMLMSLFAVPFGISSGFYTALIGGGPVSLIWGFLLVGFFQECVAVSLGEIHSCLPTSGGPYYWSHCLAPRRFKHALSYTTGWLYLLAIWMLDLGTHYGTVILIFGAVNIWYPDYVAPAWVLLVATYGLYLLSTVVCWKLDDYVPMLDKINAVWTGIGLVVITTTLLATHQLGFRSASFVFTDYDWSFSGWGQGFTFFIGLLPGCFVMCGVGFITSMSEEVAVPTKQASLVFETFLWLLTCYQIPRAMVMGIPLAVLSGLVMILGCLFTLPDVATLLAAPGGTPVPVILSTVTGSQAGGTILLSIVISNAAIACVANQFVSSRTTWAFSRDDALPLSSLWASVDNNSQPRNALFVSTLVQMLVTLLSLGSSSAFNAFLNVGIIGVDLSYGLPIFISLLDRRRTVSSAPYNMGWIGVGCNVITTVWVAFSLVLFCMPIAIPVTATSANYAPAVLAFFMGFSGLWFALRARKTYRGPPANLNLEEHH